MTPEEAILGLQAHSAGTADCSSQSFADAVWRWRNGGHPPDFESLALAIVELLQAILGLGLLARPDAVPRAVAYSIAELMTSYAEIAITSDDPTAAREATRSAWVVACAWEAATAGDVDSLIEHVRLEQRARGMLA